MKKSMTVYYSQTGQDKFLEENVFKGFKGGFFMDIGAHDGIWINNTFYFDKNHQWTGINIEPIPEVFEKLVKNRSTCINLNCAVSNESKIAEFILNTGHTESISGLLENYDPRHKIRLQKEINNYGGETKILKVETKTIESILLEKNVKHIHYLSIDVEGAEFEVIKSINFDNVFIDVIDFENNYEDTTLPIINYLIDKGYSVLKHYTDIIMIHKNSQFHKTYHINYSDSLKFIEATQYCNYTAKHVAGFDEIISYTKNDIDHEFLEKNKHIFLFSKGGGYWLWKPYILKKTLQKLQNGDILAYSDVCSYYVSNIEPLKKLIKEDSKGVLSFEFQDFSEKMYTKKDTFQLMNLDDKQYTDTFHREASYIWIRKNEFTVKLVDEFLDYAQNELILTDLKKSQNYPEFIDHRHDQSIWSLLCKKYEIKPHRLISQYGLPVKNHYPEDSYEQITFHHRNPNFVFPNYSFIDVPQHLKTGVLIASTSKGCNWKSPQDCYLNNTLESLFNTNKNSKNLFICIGIDHDDPFYRVNENRLFFEDKFQVEFFVSRAEKGHVTKIWNELAHKAINENCEYLFQCGDDITFHRPGWLEECQKNLKSTNNFGMTGPLTNQNSYIITQCFVHKTHYDIFGYFFPEEIKNWFCDDWINEIYPSSRICTSFNCDNKVIVQGTSDPPRYEVVFCRSLCTDLVIRDRAKIRSYALKHKISLKSEILLSVLILSIPSRLSNLIHIYEKLMKQVGSDDRVEILTLVDNKLLSIGAKRQSLLDISRGRYLAFLDDDDDVSNDYIQSLLSATKENSDVITFDQHCNVNGQEFLVNFGVGNPHESLHSKKIKRPPYHICAWSSKIAKQIKFQDISYGEDIHWCSGLYPFLKSETHIDKILHFYQYSDKTSESIQFK